MEKSTYSPGPPTLKGTYSVRRYAAGVDGSIVAITMNVDPFRKALGRVTAKHRRVLIDHFIHGHSVKQIAKRQRIPVGTALSRVFAAKRALRTA